MPLPKRIIAINIIGAGRVGTTLAVMLSKKGHRISSIISHSSKSAKKCAQLVGCRNHGNDLSLIQQDADLTLIATPDDVVESVVGELRVILRTTRKKVYVAHTSGSKTSEVLSPLTEFGGRIFSIHPIQSFPLRFDSSKQVSIMKGITYGFEGEKKCESFARWLVKELNGKRMLIIPKERKNLYHIACVFASNYLLTTLSVTEELGKHFEKNPLDPFFPLIEQSVHNLKRRRIEDALSGPIVRGDLDTVRSHLNDLKACYPELVPLYAHLGLQLLRISSLEDGKKSKIKEVLEKALNQK